MSLRRRLAVLLVCAVVPIALLLVGSALSRRSADERRTRAEAVMHLDEFARDVQAQLDETSELLRILAESRDVTRGSDAECAAALAGVARVRPGLNALTRGTPAGWVTCAAPAIPRPIYVGDLPAFRRVSATRRLSAGDFQISRATGQPILVVGLPLLEPDGRLHAVLAASLKLSWLTRFAERHALALGGDRAQLQLFDSAGVVLVRSGADSMIGRPVHDPELLRQLPASGHRVHEALGPDGEARLYVVRAVAAGETARAFAAFSIPLRAIRTDAERVMWRDLALLGAVSLLVLVVGGAMSRRLVLQPLAALTTATGRLRAGDLSARATPAVLRVGGEVAQLAHDFDLMADAVERRTREYRSLADSSPDFITRVDAEERVVFVNRSLAVALSTAPAALVGRRVDELPLSDGGHRAWREHGRRTLRDGAPRSVLVSDILDGAERTLDVRYVAERDEEGRLSHVMIVARDISAQRRAEARLQRAQRLDSLGQLTGGLAHDFGNLLGTILNSAELALLELPSQATAREDVATIRDAAQRGGSLVRQLLAFARREPIDPVPVVLQGVLHGLEPLLQRVAGASIALELQPAAEPAWVRADPGQLEQVVMNLCLNARDAMPGGGVLSLATAAVTLGVHDPRGAELGLAPGEYALLEVRDTGTGMSLDVQARLFEPFFTTKADGSGTGLGLANSYAIVQQHGGQIAVRSAPGAGATFTIWLPRIAAPSPAGAPEMLGLVERGVAG